MFESNDSDQEPSAVQHHESDGCPNCGGTLQAVTRRGPTDATAQPCGSFLDHVDVQPLATTEVDA